MPFIEKIDAPAASQVGQELRKQLYSIMGLTQVKELQRIQTGMGEQVLKIAKSKIDLAGSVKLSAEQRSELVLNIIL